MVSAERIACVRTPALPLSNPVTSAKLRDLAALQVLHLSNGYKTRVKREESKACDTLRTMLGARPALTNAELLV